MIVGGAARSRVALLSLALASCSAAAPPSPAPSALLGIAAPDFRRAALDGSAIDTAALRGRVVVLDFFAEHCAPCAESLPALEALHRAMPEVAVVGVSEDDEVGGAQRMSARYELTFPIAHDNGHVLAGRFRVGSMPATFVLDARGVVRWHGTTAHSEPELRAVVKSVR
jgi:cytochrome c biogenesis protein CcmG, thiol:disulfide interchange protein DsbE